MQKALAAIAAFVLLAWLYLRRAAAAKPPVADKPPPTTVQTGSAQPPPAAPPPTAVTAYPPAPDVAGDVADGEADVLADNFENAGSGAWQADAYRQLWLPAARIKISDISAQEWHDVGDFFNGGGGFGGRRDDLGKLGQTLLDEANSDGGAATFESVFGAIEGLIPIVGGILSKADQATQAQLSDQSAWDTAMGDGQLGQQILASLPTNDSRTHAIMANYNDDGIQFGPDAQHILDSCEAALTWDQLGQNLSATVPLHTMDWNTPEQDVQAGPNGEKFRLRMRLFTKYPGGWLFPWLSVYFNGNTGETPTDPRTGTSGLRAVINKRARIFRAIDVLICAANPYTRESPPFGYNADQFFAGVFPLNAAPRVMGPNVPGDKTVFFYVNPLAGPMMGSIFPPTLEDTRYVSSKDGRQYSYYGEPMTNPNPGYYDPATNPNIHGIGSEEGHQDTFGYFLDNDIDPQYQLTHGPASATPNPVAVTVPSAPAPTPPNVVVPVVATPAPPPPNVVVPPAAVAPPPPPPVPPTIVVPPIALLGGTGATIPPPIAHVPIVRQRGAL